MTPQLSLPDILQYRKSLTVSIIMLVSGHNNIIVLPNCTMLYYVFSGPLSLRAYVPEIKFNNKYATS